MLINWQVKSLFFFFISSKKFHAKTRIQSDIVGSKYKGLASTIMNIYHEGGIKTLYKGGIARTTRACGAFLIFNLVGEVYKNMKI